MSYTYPLDEFRELWESEPLVIIDTNGFLNLYRFSPETSNHILDVLNTIPKNQFWIPAQVTYEFNENHEDVIKREHNKYKEVTKEVERIMLITSNDISKQFIRFNKFRFPLIKQFREKINDAITSIYDLSEDYKEEIKEEVKKNVNMLKEDKVKFFFDELVNEGCVGPEFNITTMLDIFLEGEQRYKYKIPPGYMDEIKDKKDNTKRKKFGDLILWKQILDKAHLCQKSIIFITQDEKEDWWVLDKEKSPVSPRKELLMEFEEYSEHPLYMMNMTNFVKHISVINDIVDFTSDLEMNAESICLDLIEKAGWDVTADSNGRLTSYLIHSGDLQDFLGQPLQDVEISEFRLPEVSIYTVDFIDDEVFIEGTFETQAETIITESYSKNYLRDSSAVV